MCFFNSVCLLLHQYFTVTTTSKQNATVVQRSSGYTNLWHVTQISTAGRPAKNLYADQTLCLFIDLDEFKALLLTNNDDEEDAQLIKILSTLEYITWKLQDPSISLDLARTLFNEVTEKYPSTCSRLSQWSTVSEHPQFKTSVVNILCSEDKTPKQP